jgi:hypothetical protein
MKPSPPILTYQSATIADIPLLAEWNHQLIRDEGHRNPMGVAKLAERMSSWTNPRSSFNLL